MSKIKYLPVRKAFADPFVTVLPNFLLDHEIIPPATLSVRYSCPATKIINCTKRQKYSAHASPFEISPFHARIVNHQKIVLINPKIARDAIV